MLLHVVLLLLHTIQRALLDGFQQALHLEGVLGRRRLEGQPGGEGGDGGVRQGELVGQRGGSSM